MSAKGWARGRGVGLLAQTARFFCGVVFSVVGNRFDLYSCMEFFITFHASCFLRTVRTVRTDGERPWRCCCMRKILVMKNDNS